MQLNIGAHLSIASGFERAGETALEIGANTFQFFTRNPRGGAAKAIMPEDVRKLDEILQGNSFAPLLAHSPYTINMASDSEDVRRGARELITMDLEALDKLPCSLYNIHPGSSNKSDAMTGVERIAEIVNEVLKPEHSAYFVFETMSGKGSEVGKTFEEIKEMIDRIELADKIGVCLDTCHVFCAGYDIVGDLDGVLTDFDKTIGLDRLKAIHLNDTMNPFASHKDRHEKIGKGAIGMEAFIRIINHPALCSLPFFLETPNELDGYAEEIKLLRDKFIR